MSSTLTVPKINSLGSRSVAKIQRFSNRSSSRIPIDATTKDSSARIISGTDGLFLGELSRAGKRRKARGSINNRCMER